MASRYAKNIMYTPDTITIYNKTIESNTEAYYRTVVSDVYWESTVGASRRASGEAAEDKAFVAIPLDAENYIAPVDWEALADHSTNWTLKPGDYIVKNSVADEITALFTISDLRKKYDDVRRITSVDPLHGRSTVGHFEVRAK